MAEFTGKNLYIKFGTTVLSGDYRSLSSSPEIGLVQSTAGSDADHTYLTTIKDGRYSYSGLAQVGGSVLLAALLEGTEGTLEIGPEGTANGKPKETAVCISLGAQFNYPYDNVVEISCEFQKTGARTIGVYP
jgi:hypothetical protein